MRKVPCNLWTMISDNDSLSTDSRQEAENDSVDELRRYSRIDDVMRLLSSAKWESRRYTSHVAQKPEVKIQMRPTCVGGVVVTRSPRIKPANYKQIRRDSYVAFQALYTRKTHLISYMPQETEETINEARASLRMFSFIKAWSKAYEHSDRLTPLAYIKLKNKLEKWFKPSSLKRRVLRRTQIVYNPEVTDIAPENRLKFKRIWQRIQKEYGVRRLILNNIIKQSELTKITEEKQKAQFQSVAKTLAAKERQRITSMKQSGSISQKELQIYLDYLKNKRRFSETGTSAPEPEIIRKSEKIPFVETSNPEKFNLEPLIKENIPETFFHDSLSTDVCRLSEESSDSNTREQLDWLRKTSHTEDEEFTDISNELLRPFRQSTETSSTGTFRVESMGIFDEGSPERYFSNVIFCRASDAGVTVKNIDMFWQSKLQNLKVTLPTGDMIITRFNRRIGWSDRRLHQVCFKKAELGHKAYC
ncbi:hypothetical protein CLF_105612 [Clonorchis sinensis]|uniref:Uncharacterized protein n=1 Tax=Clonorchis sinensis TaxID=79923 RepID=G7YDT6_CLOSI|nr:hypothetical protein CLF_105612 [Clonorchis sinensis]